MKKYTGEQGIKWRKKMGCTQLDVANNEYKPNQSGPMMGSPHILYKKCIGNYFDFGALSYMSKFNYYLKGEYFEKGTHAEQPNKFVEVMNLIHNLKEETRIEKEETLKRINSGRKRS